MQHCKSDKELKTLQIKIDQEQRIKAGQIELERQYDQFHFYRIY